MSRRQPASKPSWTDVKAELASFDRLGLLGLIQDLYAAHKDNQIFLHARFGLGADVLKPYKVRIPCDSDQRSEVMAIAIPK